MPHPAATLLRIFVATIMVATVLAAAIVLYARSQGLLIYSVQSGSMQPTIRRGDAILVRQQPPGLEIGDVISYRSLQDPDVIITHRIIAFDSQRKILTTRGDALETADPPFAADRVVGLTMRTIPIAGYGLNFIRHPAGLAAAVYVPAAVLIILEIRRLMRYYASQRYELFYY